MKLKMEKAVSILLTSTLLLSMLLISIPRVHAQGTTVRIIPSPIDIYANGTVFDIAVVVEDVRDLTAIVLELDWDPSKLEYQSHTLTMPVQSYPSPVPPSPYPGILEGGLFFLNDTADQPRGKYNLDVATLPSTLFNGSGTVIVMTFKTIWTPGYGTPTDYVETIINATNLILVDGVTNQPITYSLEPCLVWIHYEEYVYPPVPMMKVDPPLYEAGALGEVFPIDVWLLGEGDTDLDQLWDVGGIDVYLNFDPTLMEATNVAIDPDGTFAAFWPRGIHELIGNGTGFEINNTAGWVRAAFIGLPGPNGTHTPPTGQIRMFSVNFMAILESETFPPPSAPITLKNPIAYTGEFIFDSIGGLIDPIYPVGTMWHELSPVFSDGPFELLTWEDNGDGELSPSDQVMLNHTGTGYYFDYHIEHITGTLNLTQQPFSTVESYIWAASFGPDNLDDNGLPGRYVGTDDPYNGYGVPYWTGNFSMPGLDSVNTITVHALPFTGDEYTYTLTEGVDYLVHADDDLIELLTPVDVDIINEVWQDGVNNSLNGWPWINYVASGISSVYVYFPNGTERYGRNFGYAEPPPSEWWFDPDWTWELEGWWALGYFPGWWNWPAGSIWKINYTAASYLEIDFNSEPDPNPRYIEFRGTYDDFLAALVSPMYTMWDEVPPYSWREYNLTGWDDTDVGGMISESDYLTFYETDIGEERTYHVEGLRTDITAQRKPWICEVDPTEPFYDWAPIVSIAGFPHPERDLCPWHNHNYSVPIPHVVQDGQYVAPFKPVGGFIDIYTQYDDPYGGQGRERPSDMFWPQKEVVLHADVSYAGWPEQNKDVAFQVIGPYNTTWGIFYARTDANGTASVAFRLPWPCIEPEFTFGEWTVIATVDVACVVVNDTLTFKYYYKVNIWKVTTDLAEYRHSEDINITISYGTYAMQQYNITFTVTVVDASGVPFGFDYAQVVIGGAAYCTYANGTVQLSVHVVKFARPPIGTIYVGALNGFPQDGGSAETSVYELQISILAE